VFAWTTWTRRWPSSSAGAPASRWSRAPSGPGSGSPSSRRPTTSGSSSSNAPSCARSDRGCAGRADVRRVRPDAPQTPGDRMIRLIFLVMLALVVAVPSGYGAPDIDRTAVDFKTPSEIKWVRNAAGTNESAVLFGDPSKPGPYVVRVKWFPGTMSRPHFHPNDRFFAVLSGTWWMGAGETFDPDKTVPAPAGSYVIHYGGKVHY